MPEKRPGLCRTLNMVWVKTGWVAAKMTYLDTNIVVKVVDSTKDDYKVQLSKNHYAYLPKDNFKTDSSINNSSVLS